MSVDMDVVGVKAVYLPVLRVCTAHINGQDRAITVSLTKYCIESSMMMDPLWTEKCWNNFNYFKYFIIILIVSTNYIFVYLFDNKVFYLRLDFLSRSLKDF